MKPLLIFTCLLYVFTVKAQGHKYDSILRQMIQKNVKVNNTYMVFNDKVKGIKPLAGMQMEC